MKRITSFIDSFREYSLGKNIIFSNLAKVFAIGINLLMVPVLLDYLGTTDYGIWLTISSVVNWFIIFDFGARKGLRNGLTIAIANGDDAHAKSLTTVSYVFLLGLSLIITVIFVGLSFWIDLSSLINFSPQRINEIRWVLLIFFFSIMSLFVLRNIETVLAASHKNYVNQVLSLINVASIAVIVLFLLQTAFPPLMSLAVVYAVVPILIYLVYSKYLFATKFRSFSPNLKSFKRENFKSIGGIGLQFFVLQLSALIIFSSDNLLIAHYLSPGEVGSYHTVYKYFQILYIPFVLLGDSMWSAYTVAYQEKRYDWIKNKLKQMIYIWLVFILICLILYFIHEWVFQLWVGDRLEFPLMLTQFMMVYIIHRLLAYIYGTFLNAIGALKIQLIPAVIIIFVNIPLSVYFMKNLEMGSAGVILATICCDVMATIIVFIWMWRYFGKKNDDVQATT